MSGGEPAPRPGEPPQTSPDRLAAPVRSELPAIPEVTLLAEIARGGMGVVYRGRQDFLDRDVAVKLLSPHLQGERFTARFRREAKILAGIKHPNIVTCHMAGTTATGQSYLVMEYVAGPSLETWIAEHGAIPVPSALRLARQLASALGHACDLGVIHRDVKPANILLEALASAPIDDRFPFAPKLVDLGLARMMSAGVDVTMTAPGAVVGTPATMAPEQFDSPDAVDFRGDIYGLGCVLYEMLTGAAAFASDKLTDLVVQKRQPQGPDPCERNRAIPAAVGRFVASMLAHDPNDRPADYQMVCARLDALAAARPDGGKQTGPNLLRTAEFEFLAGNADLGSLGGEPVPSRDPRGCPSPARAAQNVPGPAPVAAPMPAPAVVPPASVTERKAAARRVIGGPRPAAAAVPLPRPRGRRRLVVGLAATMLGLAALPVVRRRGKDDALPPAVPPPAPAAPAVTNERPRDLAIHGLDGETRPDVRIELRAAASDREGDELSYRWSVRPEAAARLATPAGATTVLELDGLPGDEVTVALEVRDAGGPATVERTVVLAYQPVDLLADFIARETGWQARSRMRGDWRRRESGAVWCLADDTPCFLARRIEGTTWRVEGRLWPERAGNWRGSPQAGFAQTAVCLRLGMLRHLAVVCTREGLAGERWSVALQEVDREDGRGGFAFKPLARQPKQVAVVDEAGKFRGAFFTITRRGEQLTVLFGFPGIGELAEHSERVRPEVDGVQLSLFARGGRGVFPELALW